MKSPHTSGRKGQARVAEYLRKKKTQIERLVGQMSMSRPILGRMGLPLAKSWFLVLILKGMLGDWAWVFQGLPMPHTHPYRIALQEDQASRVAIQARVDELKETLEMRLVEEAMQRKEDMERFCASFSQGGSQVHPPTDRRSSSHARDDFLTELYPATTAQMGTTLCKLIHLTKRPASVVSYG